MNVSCMCKLETHHANYVMHCVTEANFLFFNQLNLKGRILIQFKTSLPKQFNHLQQQCSETSLIIELTPILALFFQFGFFFLDFF